MKLVAGDADATLSKLTSGACRRTGVPAELLEGYPEMLRDVLATGRKLDPDELANRREAGRKAAEGGVSLRALIDLYLSVTTAVWRELARGEEPLVSSGVRLDVEAGFRAVDDAVVALAEGYEGAHQLALREEESARREFIDDLFYGRGDLGRLAARAQRFGLRLAEAHIVSVARAERPFGEATAVTRRIESALSSRYGTRDLLVITKDEMLVCIAPSTLPEASDEFARQVAAAVGTSQSWRVGIGREHRGPGGVLRSYEEARGCLDLAARLGHTDRVVKAVDFLVFQVLLRDRSAMADLITTVLEPLQQARGGAAPLVDTLAAYFACGTIPATARELSLSVRAVSYRLDRVRHLTGYSATDPTQHFTLEAAVLGAKLLDWPAPPLTSES